jgi:hypothetical protein
MNVLLNKKQSFSETALITDICKERKLPTNTPVLNNF